jgi:soluble lytic murein transglycosylase-like protein
LDTVYRQGFKYGFKPDLVLGIIKVESNYNPKAVSYKGAYGLMQINLGVWKDELNIDVGRIFDIAYNIDTGLRILKQYYEETRGNIKLALHFYNNGYKYNNTAYAVKVDSAALSFNIPPHASPAFQETVGY